MKTIYLLLAIIATFTGASIGAMYGSLIGGQYLVNDLFYIVSILCCLLTAISALLFADI